MDPFNCWALLGPGPCWAHSGGFICWALLGLGLVGPIHLLGPVGPGPIGPIHLLGHSFVGPFWHLWPLGPLPRNTGSPGRDRHPCSWLAPFAGGEIPWSLGIAMPRHTVVGNTVRTGASHIQPPHLAQTRASPPIKGGLALTCGSVGLYGMAQICG